MTMPFTNLFTRYGLLVAALLCPGLSDEQRVHILEKPLGSYGVAGQLPQRPVSREGGRFRRAWFGQVVEAASACAQRLREGDRAATAGGGCSTCGVLLARAWNAAYVAAPCLSPMRAYRDPVDARSGAVHRFARGGYPLRIDGARSAARSCAGRMRTRTRPTHRVTRGGDANRAGLRPICALWARRLASSFASWLRPSGSNVCPRCVLSGWDVRPDCVLS